MATVTVRTAGVDDAAGIAAVRVRSWRVAYRGQVPDQVLDEMDPVTEAERRRQWFSAPDPSTATVVAVDGAEIVGFVSFGPARLDDTFDRFDPREGEVYAIYVDPPRWGRGAGRSLMDAAVAELDRRGRRPVRLWVLRTNERSRRFYERYGFVLDGHTGTFRIDRDGQPPVELDEVRYVLHRPR